MSTDITVGSAPDDLVDFDDFVSGELPQIARAIAVVAGDHRLGTGAATNAMRAAYLSWNHAALGDEPGRRIFSVAVTHCSGASHAPATATRVRAVAVARYALGWSPAEISTHLSIESDDVDSLLEQATTEFVIDDDQHDVPNHVRDLVENAQPAMPDLELIMAEQQRARRRRRLKQVALVGCGALLLLIVANRATSNADRSAEADPLTSQSQSTEPTSSSQPETEREVAQPAAGAIGNEPRPDLVPRPELLATDGRGGFVGVRSASTQNPQTLFTRSDDGFNWELVSAWNLGASARMIRLERSGANYMLWIEGVDRSSEQVIGTVAVSSDLIGWTVLELSIDDPQPYGLIYQPRITDLSVSGDSVLALVDTTVDIDFTALLLSEGYTCGQTITRTEVSVNLCNDQQLDVLSVSDVEELPARTRLFLSSDGRGFEQISAPFGDETAAHLTNVNGEFAITDETGVRFATSEDAITWRTIAAGKPPFAIRAAATDETNQVVGLGETDNGDTVIFRTDDATTTTTPLVDLLGDVSPDIDALVASGPSMWVMYVFEPKGDAWILTSVDAQQWNVLLAPPPGDSPRLLVGDDEVLVQWSLPGSGVITTGIPLS